MPATASPDARPLRRSNHFWTRAHRRDVAKPDAAADPDGEGHLDVPHRLRGAGGHQPEPDQCRSSGDEQPRS